MVVTVVTLHQSASLADLMFDSGTPSASKIPIEEDGEQHRRKRALRFVAQDDGDEPVSDADATQQPDDAQDAHQPAEAKTIDVRNAGDEINPTPFHEGCLPLRAPEANDEVDEQYRAHCHIQSLKQCRDLARDGDECVH